MVIGKVIGSIVSTRKHDSLVGSKLMVVELLGNDVKSNKIIAVDVVGAGIGETVLITQGSSARIAMHNSNASVDAVIVGIVDEENDMNMF